MTSGRRHGDVSGDSNVRRSSVPVGTQWGANSCHSSGGPKPRLIGDSSLSGQRTAELRQFGSFRRRSPQRTLINGERRPMAFATEKLANQEYARAERDGDLFVWDQSYTKRGNSGVYHNIYAKCGIPGESMACSDVQRP